MSTKQQSELFCPEVVKGRVLAQSHQARQTRTVQESGEVRIHFDTDLHQSLLTCQSLTAKAISVINRHKPLLAVQCEPFLSVQTSKTAADGSAYSLHAALEKFPADLDGGQIVRAVIDGFNGHPEPIARARENWESLSEIECEIYDEILDVCLKAACNMNAKCFPVALDLYYGKDGNTETYVGTIDARHSQVKREVALPEPVDETADGEEEKPTDDIPKILLCTSTIVRWEKNVGRPTIFIDDKKVDIELENNLLTPETIEEWSNEVTPATKNKVYEFYLEETGDKHTQYRAFRVEDAPGLAMTSHWIDDERHVTTARTQANDCNESEGNEPDAA